MSSAIHIPIKWDSPCFIQSTIPTCQHPTMSYKYFNDLVNLYMNVETYQDTFKTNNDVYYYPKSVVENHNQNKPFKKILRFQWRRVWLRGRTS